MAVDLLSENNTKNQPKDLLADSGSDLLPPQPTTGGLLAKGLAATGALALGAPAAVGVGKLAQRAIGIGKMVPTALSSNYGTGYKADEFANKVNEAFVQTHTDKIKEFGIDLDKWVEKNPSKRVDISDLVTDIQSDPDISRQAIRILKKTPILEDILTNPNSANSVPLKDAQSIINHLNKKIKLGGYDIQESINNIKGAQIEAFPEMGQTRANYADFMDAYKPVKRYFKVNKTLPAIENKFGGAQGNVRVNKILPEDIMGEINSYRAAAKLTAPVKSILKGLLGRAGGMFSFAQMPLQAMGMAQDLNKYRQEASQMPNGLSTLDPMTGMPKIVNKEDLMI